MVGSFDHAKRRRRQRLRLRFFAAVAVVVVVAGNKSRVAVMIDVVVVVAVVVGVGARGPPTGHFGRAGTAVILVHRWRSPDAVRTRRFGRQGVAAPSGQTVLDPPVRGQPVQLPGAFLQKALARRARFRRIAFRPKMIGQLPLADRVPFHSPQPPPPTAAVRKARAGKKRAALRGLRACPRRNTFYPGVTTSG